MRAAREALERSAGAVADSAKEALEDVAEYAAQRAEHLASLVGKAGFAQAVEAERHNVELRAAIVVADLSDAAMARLAGGLEAVLSLGAGLNAHGS